MSGKYCTNWDLSCLYGSIDSPEIQLDKNDILRCIENFAIKFYDNLSVSNLIDAVQEYEGLYSRILKIETYAALYYQIHLKDEAAASFYQNIMEWRSVCFSRLCRFVNEIQKLDYYAIIEKLKDSSGFGDYRSFIDEVFRFRDHTLSVSEESILSRIEVVAGSAWHKFHEGILSRIDFNFDGKVLTLSDIVEKANYGENEEIRKQASIALSDGLKRNSYSILSAFNNVVLSHKTFGEVRKYTTPESQRFLADNISETAVNSMMDAIVSSYQSVCHRYYKLKARILGKEKLQYWDRCSNVSLSELPERKYSYDESIDVVLSVFKNFSETFYNVAYDMVTKSWVDVYPRDGKASGAFACPLTADLHPFILLNFYGSVRDVLTIAHEFGHGVHQALSSNVKDLVSNPPLNISETASTFAEKLTNAYLLSEEKDPKRRIELMCSRLDDVMSTVFRQAAFFRFEQKIHRLRGEGELSGGDMDKAWREVLSESLGDGVELHSCIDNLWGYITHFTSCPFYVYSYSFGCLFVEGLYAEYQRSGKDFISKYESILKSGGTKSCSEIVEMFGIDINSGKFWRDALDSIKREIDDLEALCDRTLCC